MRASREGAHAGVLATTPSLLAARVICSHTFTLREPSTAANLTPDALTERLTHLIGNDPALFLERYGTSLTEQELQFHFDARGACDYEVRFHLARLRRSSAEATQRKRNRRWRCLQELERQGEFFSDHEVQRRAPKLYHAYVGWLLPPDVPADHFDDECTLSQRLLANLDADERSQRAAEAAAAMVREKEEEEEEEEEEEDDDDDEQHACGDVSTASKHPAASAHCSSASFIASSASSAATPWPGSGPGVPTTGGGAMGSGAMGAIGAGSVGAGSVGAGSVGTGSVGAAAAADISVDGDEDYVAQGWQVLENERRTLSAGGASPRGAREGGAGQKAPTHLPTAAGATASSSDAMDADMIDAPPTTTSPSHGEHSASASGGRGSGHMMREHLVHAARQELLSLMRERFLSGEEKEFFDYDRLCDNNPGFDDIEQEGRDEEERWFDDDE